MSLRRNTPRAANGVGASRADWGERNSSTPKSSNHGGGVGSGSFSIKAGNDSQRSSTDSQRSSSSNAKDDDDEDGRKPVPAKWSYRMPEDASYCDYLAYPYRSASAWMRLLCDNFGWRFIAMVGLSYSLFLSVQDEDSIISSQISKSVLT